MLDSDTTVVPAADHFVEVKTLFAEVGSLAIRLKAASVSVEGEDSFAAGGMSVLRVLDEHGPQTVPQIARRRGTSRQNIQILVNRLEADGCVELIGNPAHKRSGLVQLTGSGRNLFAKAVEQEERFLAGLTGRVSVAEVLSATSLLGQLRQMLVQAERPADMGAEKQVREERVGHAVPRVTRRGPPAPAKVEKATRVGVAPSAPETEDGDLPYNLL